MAERRGEPASYRSSAGPCPRCGSRGTIPRWIFAFHAAAAAARDQASAAENTAVYVAIGQSLVPERDVTDGDVAAGALPAALTGAWRGVAAVLWRIPRSEWAAALVMVCRMLEPVVDRHAEFDNRGTGVTASAEIGTPGAGLSPMSA
ncbi:hypothetical protein ACVBEQ_12470 [Nakamurella sp. GG22]